MRFHTVENILVRSKNEKTSAVCRTVENGKIVFVLGVNISCGDESFEKSHLLDFGIVFFKSFSFMIDISYDITGCCFFQQKIQKLLQKKCFGVIIEKENMMTKKVAFA